MNPPSSLFCLDAQKSPVKGRGKTEWPSTMSKPSPPSLIPSVWLQIPPPFLHDCWVLCPIFSPFISAIFAFHVLTLLMPEQFEALIYRQFPDLVPKALWFPFSFSEARVLGRNRALPVNPICDKDFPRCTHSMVPVLLCAWLASFWGAFVLLFHLRKDTLVTNQSSAC